MILYRTAGRDGTDPARSRDYPGRNESNGNKAHFRRQKKSNPPPREAGQVAERSFLGGTRGAGGAGGAEKGLEARSGGDTKIFSPEGWFN